MYEARARARASCGVTFDGFRGYVVSSHRSISSLTYVYYQDQALVPPACTEASERHCELTSRSLVWNVPIRRRKNCLYSRGPSLASASSRPLTMVLFDLFKGARGISNRVSFNFNDLVSHSLHAERDPSEAKYSRKGAAVVQ